MLTAVTPSTLPTPRLPDRAARSCASCGPRHCAQLHEQIERGAWALMGEAAMFTEKLPTHLLVTARIVLQNAAALPCCTTRSCQDS